MAASVSKTRGITASQEWPEIEEAKPRWNLATCVVIIFGVSAALWFALYIPALLQYLNETPE